MSVRRLVVDVKTDGLNVTRFCEEHGISTWFFWNLRKRYRLEGEVVLEPKSRAPRTVANKTAPHVEDAIVTKRKELVEAGLDAGAESIWFHLRGLPDRPSPSTIWRILRARGFIVAEPTKAPKRSRRRFQAERANECWQLDDTGWELRDGTPVKILNVVDDHSRLLVASEAMARCTGEATLDALAEAAAVIGWPARFLSDNAGAFRHVLAPALALLGVGACHSRPRHPQTNGKVERFHQTLKRWLLRQPRAATIAELNMQLDLFRHLYNHVRPHRALMRAFPAVVWANAPKAGPASRALNATTVVYRSVVDNGTVSITKRLIRIGAAYNGRSALTIVTGASAHVFIDGVLVRALTLDPTRRTQPLHDRVGRPRLA